MVDLGFRDATLDDAPRLVEIYRYYVERTAVSFEWTTPSVEEFRARMARTMERYPYLVALVGGEVVGYSYAGPFVGRAAYDWSVEMTIYLDPQMRHRGVGGALYAVMEEILRRMGILNLNACIGYPQVDDEYLTKDSARFHEHLGYHMVGRFHNSGYKFGRWYDMVWMEKILGEHTSDPEPVTNYNQLREGLTGELLTP